MADSNLIDIIIPNQGLTITEIQVSRWLKSVGDIVVKGETLMDFESDKAIMELPSPEDGILAKIVAAEGTVVEIGGVVAVLQRN
jgi:2-oxoglutarate dehydrogenase E2 component (dihydrolipoamide succinyltransferase)